MLKHIRRPTLRQSLLSRWTLAVFAAIVCLWGIGGGPRLGDHECINAKSAREALQAGNWLIPTLGETPRIRKPPLGTWLIAASAWLFEPSGKPFPVTEFSARIPQAVAAMLNILVMAWLATRMFGRRTGRVAGLVAAASVMTMYFSHSALIEMTLTLLVTTTFACFWRAIETDKVHRWWLAASYVAFALAMMAKMPLPLAIVFPSIGLYWLFVLPALSLADRTAPSEASSRSMFKAGVWTRLRRLGQLCSIPGLFVFLVLCGGWVFYASQRAGGAWQLWRQEYLDRFTGMMAEQSHSFGYYIPILLGFALPFSLFLPEAVASPVLRRYQRNRHACAFLLTWGMCGLIVLSVSAFKRPHYLAAVTPPFLILVSLVADRVFLVGRDKRIRASRALVGFVAGALVVAAVAITVLLTSRYQGISQWVYVAMAGMLALWAWAALSYGQGRRVASLAALVLASPMMLAAGWALAAYDQQQDVKIPALAAALKSARSGPGDRIIQVDSRVDARLLFYEHLPVEPLFTPAQLARLRPARGNLPKSLVTSAYERMQALIEEDTQLLFIMDAQRFESLRGQYDLPLVELARVRLSSSDPSNVNVILGRGAEADARSHQLDFNDSNVGEVPDDLADKVADRSRAVTGSGS